MWDIKYKPDENSSNWLVLESYDNKTSACFTASRMSQEYFMVKVTGEDGDVVWSNLSSTNALSVNIH